MVENVDNNALFGRLVVKSGDGIAQTILKAAKANPSIFEISEGTVNAEEKRRVKEVLKEIQAERRRDGRPDICRRNNIDLVYKGDVLEFTPEEQKRIMEAMGLGLKKQDKISLEDAREFFGLSGQEGEGGFQKSKQTELNIPFENTHKPYQQSYVEALPPEEGQTLPPPNDTINTENNNVENPFTPANQAPEEDLDIEIKIDEPQINDTLPVSPIEIEKVEQKIVNIDTPLQKTSGINTTNPNVSEVNKTPRSPEFDEKIGQITGKVQELTGLYSRIAKLTPDIKNLASELDQMDASPEQREELKILLSGVSEALGETK